MKHSQAVMAAMPQAVALTHKLKTCDPGQKSACGVALVCFAQDNLLFNVSMHCRHDLDRQESAGAVLGPNAYSPPNSGSDSDEAKRPGNTQSGAVQGKPCLLKSTLINTILLLKASLLAKVDTCCQCPEEPVIA